MIKAAEALGLDTTQCAPQRSRSAPRSAAAAPAPGGAGNEESAPAPPAATQGDNAAGAQTDQQKPKPATEGEGGSPPTSGAADPATEFVEPPPSKRSRQRKSGGTSPAKLAAAQAAAAAAATATAATPSGGPPALPAPGPVSTGDGSGDPSTSSPGNRKTCGVCRPCLNPHLKKGCLVNKAKVHWEIRPSHKPYFITCTEYFILITIMVYT